jgi:hypothetical protein
MNTPPPHEQRHRRGEMRSGTRTSPLVAASVATICAIALLGCDQEPGPGVTPEEPVREATAQPTTPSTTTPRKPEAPAAPSAPKVTPDATDDTSDATDTLTVYVDPRGGWPDRGDPRRETATVGEAGMLIYKPTGPPTPHAIDAHTGTARRAVKLARQTGMIRMNKAHDPNYIDREPTRCCSGPVRLLRLPGKELPAAPSP